MKLSAKKLLAVPAALLVAVAAGVLGLSAVNAASVQVSQRPQAADVQTVAPADLAPATTARDWEEVRGTRTRPGFR